MHLPILKFTNLDLARLFEIIFILRHDDYFTYSFPYVLHVSYKGIIGKKCAYSYNLKPRSCYKYDLPANK